MKNEQILIRKAQIQDAGELARISEQDLGYPCATELVSLRLEQLDCKRDCVFVAVYENQVIGYVQVERYETIYYETLANILGLAVAAKYRRKGAGRALMKAAEEWALQIGAVAVRLNSGMSRQQAHEFYRSIGYDTEKTQIRFMKKL